jgi:hypothetical protein
MRIDLTSPDRSPSIRLASLAAGLWLAFANPLAAQPTRRPVPDQRREERALGARVSRGVAARGAADETNGGLRPLIWRRRPRMSGD